jgi:hypothetical protein
LFALASLVVLPPVPELVGWQGTEALLNDVKTIQITNGPARFLARKAKPAFLFPLERSNFHG